MSETLIEYLQLYKRLIKKRGELDARIDFTEELIKNTVIDDVAHFELFYYDKNGNLLQKVGSR